MSGSYRDWLQTELEKLHPAEETEVLVKFLFTKHRQKSVDTSTTMYHQFPFKSFIKVKNHPVDH